MIRRRAFYSICLGGTLLVVLVFAVGSLRTAELRRDYSTVIVGSKEFGESVLLGEVLEQTALDGRTYLAEHREALGGTRELWYALYGGEIGVYVEYTGTLAAEILPKYLRREPDGRSWESIRGELPERVAMSRSIGFENSYALGMRRAHAEDLGIESISDLASHPYLRVGLSSEYLAREDDGWRELKLAYGLPQTADWSMSHEDAYRALYCDQVDVIDVYSTDPHLLPFDIVTLEDDRKFFPPYDAVLLYRTDLSANVVRQLEQVVGTIDTDEMKRMNAEAEPKQPPDCDSIEFNEEPGRMSSDPASPPPADAPGVAGLPALDRTRIEAVAAGYLEDELEITPRSQASIFWRNIRNNTLEHLLLVIFSVLPAILVALVLGDLGARSERARLWIRAVLIGFFILPPPAVLALIRWVGGDGPFASGAPPALLVLFGYSLFPVFREAVDGFSPAAGSEDRVDLRRALPSLVEGIKWALVLNMGIAILGVIVDAGGYGGPIRTSLRLNEPKLALQGAVPAVVIALAVFGAITWLQRRYLPKPECNARAEPV